MFIALKSGAMSSGWFRGSAQRLLKPNTYVVAVTTEKALLLCSFQIIALQLTCTSGF